MSYTQLQLTVHLISQNTLIVSTIFGTTIPGMSTHTCHHHWCHHRMGTDYPHTVCVVSTTSQMAQRVFEVVTLSWGSTQSYVSRRCICALTSDSISLFHCVTVRVRGTISELLSLDTGLLLWSIIMKRYWTWTSEPHLQFHPRYIIGNTLLFHFSIWIHCEYSVVKVARI